MKISKLVLTENQKPQIVISVRNLVEFLLNSGDIDDRHGGRMKADAMNEGSRIHRKLQHSAGLEYHAEVPLKYAIDFDKYELALEGRADGIIYDFGEELTPDSDVTVDEIKGMYKDVKKMKKPIEVHLAQAKVYAFIFGIQNNLKNIKVHMTYVNMYNEEINSFVEECDFETLEQWFLNLVQEYRKWADYLFDHRLKRQKSIKQLTFPYEFRLGQKKTIADVYTAMIRNKTMFLQAPTGTGKTLATIYPAVQAVGQGYTDKIFYLTAKASTGLVALEAFNLLNDRGYEGKTIVITAKDKMCPLEERHCNPVDCPYAKGHFDRVNDAVYDFLLQDGTYDRDRIIDWAKERRVCPFEFCLDVSSWVDNIICDYNYVFDPHVYLKRFFGEGLTGDYIYLVDEAHNMVDRARSMYSATIVKEEVLQAKKLLKPYSEKAAGRLDRCNKDLLVYKRQCENMIRLEECEIFLFSLINAAAAIDELLEKDVEIEEREVILDFYFKMRNFIELSDSMDEHYRIYCDYRENGDFQINLYCVDPSVQLQERLDRANCCIYFSATLLPIQYYRPLLCHDLDVYSVCTPSVFDSKKRLLTIAEDVTTKYTKRGRDEYEKYSNYIEEIASQKKGNYMVFFPSYKVMEEVGELFEKVWGCKYDVIYQSSGMTESEREAFLTEFYEGRDKTLLGFCVMGGIFAEGIDLTNERLIGSIIVGVALPQVCNEMEVIKDYFEENGRDGFSFAYLYPGLNKVVQAAGRVIRTTEDRGIIALLDERFKTNYYNRYLPDEWRDYKICNLNKIGEMTNNFWENNDE
ncbi:MAG: ATP-dependent DNA helicase [Lachnospiraceae bacterium]|nr:ATP-dependent DNA helicase [Lachnospiraceae bacterium]